MDSNGHKKFEEAIHLLNQAAKEKKEELQNLLRSKYGDIREVLEHAAGEHRERLSEEAKKIAEDALNEGRLRLKEAAEEVDASVRQNPWPYIVGAAVTALIVGYLLGSSSKEK